MGKMSAEEVLNIVKGGVSAPVGTKTFFAFMVGPAGEVRMEGTIDASVVDEVAYLLMKGKRERPAEQPVVEE